MITSAEEFLRLSDSDDPADRRRSAWEAADVSVWYEVLRRYPNVGAVEVRKCGHAEAYSENIAVREWVAHNKKLPDEIIKILAKDGSRRVRVRILGKRKTPPDVLKELAVDPDDGIRSGVAAHKNTTRDILETMLNDPSEEVVTVVKRRLSIIDKFSVDFYANRKKAPPDVLRELSTDPDEDVRYEVATHKNTPEDVLESMLSDPSESVVLSVKRKLGMIEEEPVVIY